MSISHTQSLEFTKTFPLGFDLRGTYGTTVANQKEFIKYVTNGAVGPRTVCWPPAAGVTKPLFFRPDSLCPCLLQLLMEGSWKTLLVLLLLA